jgi:hypothetical protein
MMETCARMVWRLTMATRIQCYESNFSGEGERTLGAGKESPS